MPGYTLRSHIQTRHAKRKESASVFPFLLETPIRRRFENPGLARCLIPRIRHPPRITVSPCRSERRCLNGESYLSGYPPAWRYVARPGLAIVRYLNALRSTMSQDIRRDAPGQMECNCTPSHNLTQQLFEQINCNRTLWPHKLPAHSDATNV